MCKLLHSAVNGKRWSVASQDFSHAAFIWSDWKANYFKQTINPWAFVRCLSQEQNKITHSEWRGKKATKQKYSSFRPEWLSVSRVKMTSMVAVIMKLLLRADSHRTTGFFFSRWSSAWENTDPSRYRSATGKFPKVLRSCLFRGLVRDPVSAVQLLSYLIIFIAAARDLLRGGCLKTLCYLYLHAEIGEALFPFVH